MINITKKDLEILYITNEMSPSDISNIYSCSKGTIRYKLKKYNIQKRNVKAACNTLLVKNKNSKLGKLNPMYETKLTQKHKDKISEGVKNAYKEGKGVFEMTKDIKDKISKSLIGISQSKETIEKRRKKLIGKTRNDVTKTKMRLARIDQINKLHGQAIPNYNPDSIKIIEKTAEKHGITDIQHAENGGEFYVKGLGYWVDGYSSNKNIVIEYYENRHLRTKDRDIKRKQEIIQKLNCNFIEIKEWEKQHAC